MDIAGVFGHEGQTGASMVDWVSLGRQENEMISMVFSNVLKFIPGEWGCGSVRPELVDC